MRKLLIVVATAAILACGCASVAPALLQAWPAVRSDAERGIAERVRAGEVSEGAAESMRERLRLFGEALGRAR
ncbi:MAG: hypothetical protein L0323_19090 [Planctomycetes bacterium]|nr:hypothetical protein [Planctomycetota bacterium]